MSSDNNRQTGNAETHDAGESNLRILQHVSPVGIFKMDANGKCIYVNDRWSDITGLTRDEAMGDGWLDALHPEDVTDVIQAWQDTVRRNAPFKAEYRLQGIKSRAIWVLGQAIADRDSQGNILGFVGAITDVSEIKKVELQLQIMESAIDTSLNAIAMADVHGRLTYVNTSFLRLWKLSRNSQALGRHALDFWLDRDKAGEVIQALLQDGYLESELTGKRGDASTFLVKLTAHLVRDHHGQPLCMMASFLDITQQKQAEKLLIQEKNFKSAVLDAAGALIVVLDRQGGIETFNAECEEVTGYKAAEVLGKFIWDILLEQDDVNTVRAVFNDLHDTGIPGKHENVWVTRKGERRTISWSDSVINDDAGLPLHIISIGVDITDRLRAQQELQKYRENLEELVYERTRELEKTIARVELENTERKKAEASLVRAKEEAELANRFKSEFLGRMSHELRTPMNAILGFGQLLESDNLSGEQKSYADEILRAGRHLLVLIDEVLNLSRIESGKIELKLEHVCLADVIRDATALVWQEAEGRNIEIRNDVLDEDMFVFADYERFKEVFVNLLSNAIKYNRKQGKVSIGCRKVGDSRVRVWVQDTGVGISKEKQQVVFEPFNRLGAEFSEIEGTGIGLTITRQLVERMRGEIGLESEEGIGSIFWVEVNLVPYEEVAPLAGSLPGPVQESDESDACPFTVLYIEDDRANMRLVRHVMEKIEGVSLLMAEEGHAGLVLAKEKLPDLVIIDINLPGMNGFEILNALKADEKTACIPAIALSAAAMPADIERGLRAGFDRYLTKPINIKTLRDAVQEYRLAPEAWNLP